MRLYQDNRHDRSVDRSRISDETKMGIVLLVVALVALGGYAAVLFIGFLLSLMSS